MIIISNKENCCGCSACVSICPQQCIAFKEDSEGFLYPSIHAEKCIDCGTCEDVCPVMHQSAPTKPLHAYAAKNINEEIRLQSSSGGFFSLLAEKMINEGGVVFGAKFNKKWEVVHGYTETIVGISDFRGSKYVQSNLENVFIKVKAFLKEGRKVFFSGTPCQIAGLKLFLRKEYPNLLTVDIICHGVPSPSIWQKYLSQKITDSEAILYVNFRDKTLGWSRYHLTLKIQNLNNISQVRVFSESAQTNTFMRGFLSDLYTRPSCQQCPAKSLKSRSDITIADFWGVHNILHGIDDENKGVSAVFVNSGKAKECISMLKVDIVDVSYEAVRKHNPSLEKSALPHAKRALFFAEYVNCQLLDELIERHLKLSFKQRLMGTSRRILRRIK